MSGDGRKGRRGVTVLRVPGKHALDTHAYALNALDGTPSVSTAEEVQTDYAVRVDVWVHWDVFLFIRLAEVAHARQVARHYCFWKGERANNNNNNNIPLSVALINMTSGASMG